GRIARRVFALRRIREFRARPEHMTRRVDRTGRHLETGLGRTGVPIEPARCFLKFGGLQLRRFLHLLALMFARIRSASTRQSALRANSSVPLVPNTPASARSAI